MEVYFDNSATTKPFPQVVKKMAEVLEKAYGNPSSLHKKGLEAEKEIKQVRGRLAKALGAKASELSFCSGGTEANNSAVFGIAKRYCKNGNHLITTKVEHPSVLNAYKRLEQDGFTVTYLPVDQHGNLCPNTLKKALTKRTILVSIMHVNNEIGTVLPIRDLGSIIKENSPAYFHVDAVQGFGKLGLNPGEAGVDLLTISAHKLHGPKGVGALYRREGLDLYQLLYGGEQEGARRPGTENVAGIAGFGEALKLLDGAQGLTEVVLGLKAELIEGLKSIPGCHLHGEPQKNASFVVNAWFEGINKAEVLLHMLEEDGVYVSSGSACHSKNPAPSHVLQAIGATGDALNGAIRISLGFLSAHQELVRFIEVLERCVKELRNI